MAVYVGVFEEPMAVAADGVFCGTESWSRHPEFTEGEWRGVQAAVRGRVARVRSRLFPVRKEDDTTGIVRVPWVIAEAAWRQYRREGGLDTIESVAERGGLSSREMDGLLPGWRDLSEVTASKRYLHDMPFLRAVADWIVPYEVYCAPTWAGGRCETSAGDRVVHAVDGAIFGTKEPSLGWYVVCGGRYARAVSLYGHDCVRLDVHRPEVQAMLVHVHRLVGRAATDWANEIWAVWGSVLHGEVLRYSVLRLDAGLEPCRGVARVDASPNTRSSFGFVLDLPFEWESSGGGGWRLGQERGDEVGQAALEPMRLAADRQGVYQPGWTELRPDPAASTGDEGEAP